MDRTEQELVRIEKVKELKEKGIEPFGSRFDVDTNSKEIKEKYDNMTKEELHEVEIPVAIAGRIMTKRGKGKVGFMHIQDKYGQIQIYVRKDVVAQNPSYHVEQPYSTTKDIEPYMGSQNKYENSDMHIQLSGLETLLFSRTYSQDPVGLRLNRLERKIFQRDFSSDDDYLRMQRLQAAANAQQTARLYEANKIQKFTSTGLQIGSIILMILALIL